MQSLYDAESAYNVGNMSVRLCLSTGIRALIFCRLFKSTFARQNVGSSGETSLHCARIVPHGSTICHTWASAKTKQESGAMTMPLTASLKGVDDSSRTNIPWRVPSLFGFECAVQRPQHQSRRSVFQSRGFEGESPSELLQS